MLEVKSTGGQPGKYREPQVQPLTCPKCLTKEFVLKLWLDSRYKKKHKCALWCGTLPEMARVQFLVCWQLIHFELAALK